MERGVSEARAVLPTLLLHAELPRVRPSQETGYLCSLGGGGGGGVVVSLQACSGMFPEGQSILLDIWLQNEMVVTFFF